MSTANPSTANHENHGLLAALTDALADWGGVVIEGAVAIGDITIFTWQTFTWLFWRLPRKETLLPNFYQVGVLSLPVIALTGTFIGMVLAVQAYFSFRGLGLETRLGAMINKIGRASCRERV